MPEKLKDIFFSTHTHYPGEHRISIEVDCLVVNHSSKQSADAFGKRFATSDLP